MSDDIAALGALFKSSLRSEFHLTVYDKHRTMLTIYGAAATAESTASSGGRLNREQSQRRADASSLPQIHLSAASSGASSRPSSGHSISRPSSAQSHHSHKSQQSQQPNARDAVEPFGSDSPTKPLLCIYLASQRSEPQTLLRGNLGTETTMRNTTFFKKEEVLMAEAQAAQNKQRLDPQGKVQSIKPRQLAYFTSFN